MVIDNNVKWIEKTYKTTHEGTDGRRQEPKTSNFDRGGVEQRKESEPRELEEGKRAVICDHKPHGWC